MASVTIKLQSGSSSVQQKTANVSCSLNMSGYSYGVFDDTEIITQESDDSRTICKYDTGERRYKWFFYVQNSSGNFTEVKTSGTTLVSYIQTIWNCTNTANNGQLQAGKENKVYVKVQPYILQEKWEEYKVQTESSSYWKKDDDTITKEFVKTGKTGKNTYDTFTLNPITSNTLSIYTQNSASYTDFWKNGSKNIGSGQYIDEHITKNNVTQWLTQLGIWASWYYQKNYYGTLSGTNRTLTIPIKNQPTSYVTLSSTEAVGDIKAEWYNKCANACGANTVTGLSQVSDKTQATHIAASHFTTLAQKVTTWS